METGTAAGHIVDLPFFIGVRRAVELVKAGAVGSVLLRVPQDVSEAPKQEAGQYVLPRRRGTRIKIDVGYFLDTGTLERLAREGALGEEVHGVVRMDSSSEVIERRKGMSRTKRGVRDGTGPYKGSYRAKQGLPGRRAARGEKCPKRR